MTSTKDLVALFELQKKAFAANPYPSLKQREDRLDCIIQALSSNRKRIHAALREDFSAHPSEQADFIEIFGVISRFQYVKSMMTQWAAKQPRELDPAMYGESSAFVIAQPKGVIGNIVPWNFPFDIGIGPLAEMLAGGNSVIIKPSDMTPACSDLMKTMLKDAIDESIVAVAPGDIELAKFFPTLPWDHLMYTGNPSVARSVATAAAQNLTPITLELGGKCPALYTEDAVTPQLVASVLRTKLLKSGQVCVAPDYALVPRASVEKFVQYAQEFMVSELPDYINDLQITGIINDRHVERINSLISDLETTGTRIVAFGDIAESNGRRLPLRLVIDPPKHSRVMREEIFGPILPILPYDSLEEAVHYIANNERPLGVYVYSDSEAVKSQILEKTQSGGATFNACAFQAALPNIGFGGSGQSGYGRHHGIEGFREFTNPRGVVDFDPEALALVIAPPYGSVADSVLSSMT